MSSPSTPKGITILLKYASSRALNAGLVLLCTLISSIYLGAEKWGEIVLPQTLMSVAVLLSLGVNEGMGNRIYLVGLSSRLALSSAFVGVCVLFSLAFIGCLALIASLDLSKSFLFVPVGGLSASLFSQLRIYYRNIGQLSELAKMYRYNSTSLVFSMPFVLYFSVPELFLLTLIFCQFSSYLLSMLKNDNYEMGVIGNYRRTFKVFLTYAYRGSPMILSWTVYNVIYFVERFLIISDSKVELALAAVSLTVIKGFSMCCSIVNTIFFNRVAVSVFEKKARAVRKFFVRQVVVNGIIMSTLFSIAFIIFSSSIFIELAPSYSELITVFIWQATFLPVICIYLPLSSICNLTFGGGYIFRSLLIALLCYSTSIVLIVHVFGLELFAEVYILGALILLLSLLPAMRVFKADSSR